MTTDQINRALDEAFAAVFKQVPTFSAMKWYPK